MNDLTIQPETPSQGFRPHYGAEVLSLELAKMLALVAPVTMSEDQQTAWLAAAVDSLQDIRPDEIAAVSLEIRRSVTRPSQIVPEISKLVAERRARWRRIEELQPPKNALPPAPKHIMDRDRSKFTAADWQQLNAHLESMGSKVRYDSKGKKYTVDEAK